LLELRLFPGEKLKLVSGDVILEIEAKKEILFVTPMRDDVAVGLVLDAKLNTEAVKFHIVDEEVDKDGEEED